MKFFKPYIKPLIIFFISLLVIPLLLTIQNLFNIEWALGSSSTCTQFPIFTIIIVLGPHAW